MDLVTTPNFEAADDFYADLIDAHHGLSDAESQALNARLMLILANHVGATAALRRALQIARESAAAAEPAGAGDTAFAGL